MNHGSWGIGRSESPSRVRGGRFCYLLLSGMPRVCTAPPFGLLSENYLAEYALKAAAGWGVGRTNSPLRARVRRMFVFTPAHFVDCHRLISSLRPLWLMSPPSSVHWHDVSQRWRGQHRRFTRSSLFSLTKNVFAHFNGVSHHSLLPPPFLHLTQGTCHIYLACATAANAAMPTGRWST